MQHRLWFLIVDYTLLYNATVDSCETSEHECFIYNVCQATLMNTTHEAQHVPRFAKHPIARAGANFLKILQDKPKFIYTVCHHLLFQKSVRDFDVSSYNRCLNFIHTTQVACSTREFICLDCKTCLQKKTPKMLNQVCTNGLNLYVIPLELSNLFPLKEE